LIGPEGPEADIELIALGDAVLRALGVDDSCLVLNSIGSVAARRDHNAALRRFLESPPVQKVICSDCKRRAQTNPLRVFDCKNESCQRIYAGAPTVTQFLTPEDREHFQTVCEGLGRLSIAYTIDERLVRGLDYYTRTTFEFKSARLGAQDTLCGGGRYDGLVEILGGPPTPAVGFAAGFERILAAVGVEAGSADRLDVFVCALGREASARTTTILAALRGLGLSADRDFLGRGLKAQMKEADRLRARLVLIIGDDEIARGRYTLRRMDTSDQTEIDANHDRWTADTFARRD
jgi:histidyl-tRNA synthetase